MGASQYSSLLGRFLETDPVLGGRANADPGRIGPARAREPVGNVDI